MIIVDQTLMPKYKFTHAIVCKMNSLILIESTKLIRKKSIVLKMNSYDSF